MYDQARKGEGQKGLAKVMLLALISFLLLLYSSHTYVRTKRGEIFVVVFFFRSRFFAVGIGYTTFQLGLSRGIRIEAAAAAAAAAAVAPTLSWSEYGKREILARARTCVCSSVHGLVCSLARLFVSARGNKKFL